MRGKIAKRLRKEARNLSANNPTKYTTTQHKKTVLKGSFKYNILTGTTRCTGYRRVYQDLKKALYKRRND